MYKLTTGDIDNTKQLYQLEQNELIKKMIKSHNTAHTVELHIFDAYDDKHYPAIVAALTIGDELDIPIDETKARIMFFALQVIRNNAGKIGSYARAVSFYNEFNGDYSKVVFDDNIGSINYNAKVFYQEVVPGVQIEYVLPFYNYKKEDKVFYVLSDLDKYVMLINGQKENISRKNIITLLGDVGKIKKFNNHEEIFDYIDKDIEILVECLETIGYAKQEVEFQFDKSMCLEITSDLNVIAWEELPEESSDWELKGKGKYQLNKNYNNIVPMMPKGNKMDIYTI